jgi:hypothetical protein
MKGTTSKLWPAGLGWRTQVSQASLLAWEAEGTDLTIPPVAKEREGWGTRQFPRFPVRSSGQDHVCAFLLTKGA